MKAVMDCSRPRTGIWAVERPNEKPPFGYMDIIFVVFTRYSTDTLTFDSNM